MSINRLKFQGKRNIDKINKIEETREKRKSEMENR